jgi:hypothetical protein
VVPLWSLALGLLLLGPALAPGYVLSYDMVWVPDLVLRADVLGVGSGLPRAVPSDAAIAVLDQVVPAVLLQKAVLLGALVGGGLGVDRLLRGSVPSSARLGPTARLAAVTLWQWNPLVAERLVLGHWPVLVGYAVLPWLVLGARRWRTDGRCPWWLLVLVPLGSLSVSAGLAAVLTVLVVLRPRGRTALASGALLLAAQAPWLVSGLLHAGSAATDEAGATVFALSSEGWLPGPLAALALGGVWNAEVVPASRDGAGALVGLLVLLALAAAGLWRLRRARPEPGREPDHPGDPGGRDLVAPLAVLWAVGWVLAVLTWVAPGALGAVAAVVPGAGVLRDGSRLLVLCAPLLVVLVAHGVQSLASALATLATPARALLLAAAVVWPVTVLPDAALGVAGRLHAVDYPVAYHRARAALVDVPGDVAILPTTSYREPAWNDGTKVLDPLGRYLTPVPVASDELVVDDVVVAGEDRRAREVRTALAEPDAQARADALATLGIGAVAADLTAPGESPDVAGELVLDGGGLRVTVLDGDPTERSAPAGWVVAMALAWTAYAGCLAAGLTVGLVAGLRGARRRERRNLSG